MPTDYEVGLLVGLLIGEGHFGGDGRQPHVTLRMHVRHEPLFRWLERTFPGGRLYGPYHHDGRDYYQWMARGRYLRAELIPLLASRLSPDIDAHSFSRFAAMRDRYQGAPDASHRVGTASAPVLRSDRSTRRSRRVLAESDPAMAVFDRLRATWPSTGAPPGVATPRPNRQPDGEAGKVEPPVEPEGGKPARRR
jgi:hypothetical protein